VRKRGCEKGAEQYRMIYYPVPSWRINKLFENVQIPVAERKYKMVTLT
jgi:hypothetical protein